LTAQAAMVTTSPFVGCVSNVSVHELVWTQYPDFVCVVANADTGKIIRHKLTIRDHRLKRSYLFFFCLMIGSPSLVVVDVARCSVAGSDVDHNVCIVDADLIPKLCAARTVTERFGHER